MEQQLLNGMVLASVYTLFALGLTLCWGSLDVLNLAHGAVLMFAAYGAHVVARNVDAPFALLVLVSAAMGGALTLILDLVAFRPIRKRATSKRQEELLTLIAGVGAGSIPLTIAKVQTSDQPFGLTDFRVRVHDIGPLRVSDLQIAVIVVGISLTIGLALWVSRSRTGRVLRALAVDPETCSLMGVNANAVSAGTLFGSGALAGLGGVLLMAYLSGITANTGEHLLLKGFAVIILGGVGSVWGTLVAAVVLAAGETAVVTWTSGTWTNAVSFGLILLIILVRPSGLFGARKAERV